MHVNISRRQVGLCTLVLAPFISGCRTPAPAPQAAATQSAVKSTATDARYPLHGIVLGISTQTGEITVRHDEIHGFMPSMTMPFKVRDAASLAHMIAGDEINATLIVPANNDDYVLEAVSVLRHGTQKNAKVSLPAHTLLVGETVPDIAMINQDGKKLHLDGYKGKVVLLTFIYTRCPLPKACPLMSSHFARIHRLLAEDAKAYAASHLISVTLDPEYDQAEILKRYGLSYLDDQSAGFEQWEFARTTTTDLKQLAGAFGLEFSQSNNQITHSMRTVLIDKDSKVAQVWYGSDWSPTDVAAAVKSLAMGTNKNGAK